MDDLTAFVTARLDEDEAAAMTTKIRLGAEWRAHLEPPVQEVRAGGFTIARVSEFALDHIARHDPARVLREVEAGRALVAEYRRALEKAPGNRPLLNVLVRLVRGRAAVWCDHPDYRAGWRP